MPIDEAAVLPLEVHREAGQREARVKVLVGGRPLADLCQLHGEGLQAGGVLE